MLVTFQIVYFLFEIMFYDVSWSCEKNECLCWHYHLLPIPSLIDNWENLIIYAAPPANEAIGKVILQPVVHSVALNINTNLESLKEIFKKYRYFIKVWDRVKWFCFKSHAQ